ncbi:DNA cytosine methyltransferase [Campylobacter upsaliensis]|uniref:DNA cytosine methyltransferase n=1 Tax=Campylobacter upsaliensis TaxID=28080 RepID=UPI0012CFAEEA|nr:DNA cytosine methyltransferase [Campylobacter upsaliensis]EAI6218788.1 DNA cytosine methyltransferase [Campylobacter upsaliensis]EAJ0236525.1 DNA cytosine methyltransferase [Campylobacter upsaliensis]EAJ1957254.1 DNA cytosine methyltransferase [Campylobacter upsaliensis]EAK4314500.1 DNA cytosine methyltransferase [Campylobacter upsaliensis]MCR2091632.1 DNA cytosine methyltransferase [Campylobacter upsaliensis]
MRLSGVSLFASAGLAEMYLKDCGIDIVVANELLEERAKLYKQHHKNSKMVCGDILDDRVFEAILKYAPKQLDFLLASPPCQGMSVAGKNRDMQKMLNDKRNFLVFRVIEFIKLTNPKYILIENVPAFLKIKFTHNHQDKSVVDILKDTFAAYHIEAGIYDSADYGVGQTRKRAIVKMYQRGLIWKQPHKKQHLSVKDVIGSLPSLEAGESSNLKWHFARKHTKAHIECMKHTKSGDTAFNNDKFYPQNKGKRIKAYNTTYRRIKWDEPAPTITIRNDAISSQNNVHPGRLKSDGTYSDARVLTPLELMLLSSLPTDWDIPADTPELLIRRCIGECIPPLLVKEIVSGIQV